MKILNEGTLAFRKGTKNKAALNELVQDVAMYLINHGTILDFDEDKENYYILVEHGQTKTDKQVATKLKFTLMALLGFYTRYDEIYGEK